MEAKTIDSMSLAVMHRRTLRNFLLGILGVVIVVSVGWTWRTISLKGEFASTLAASVERDMQSGDLRNAIINLDRSGNRLFHEIQYLVPGAEPQFTIHGEAASFAHYTVRIPIRAPSANGAATELAFTFDPLEGLPLLLLIVIPLLCAFSFYEFRKSMRRLTLEIEQLTQKSAAEMKLALAAQIAHDIRSPLSALNMMVGSVRELPEEKRLIIRNVAQRINDIANGLLLRDQAEIELVSKKKAPVEEPVSREPIMLISLIDSILSEKRIQYRDRMRIEIHGDLSKGYGLFSQIQPGEFARVLSNLINNSVEAFADGGRVNIGIGASAEGIEVTIEDDGAGIPKDLLARIGERGVSYGKSGTESGSGLGVYHARETLEKFGGKFKIESEVGVGTKITLTLPRAEVPAWFVESLSLESGGTLVTVDDDQTIHQIWDGRVRSASASTQEIEQLKFSSLEEFERWFKLNSKSQALFLVDYEFIGQANTGLDLLEKIRLSRNTILVTSRYEETQLRERADRLGIRVLPKSLVPIIPLQITKGREKLDAILIDDDQLVHQTWQMAAKSAGKKLQCFETPEAFFAVAKTLHTSTPVYIDVSLGNGVRGEAVAMKVSDLGFSEIHLATGHDPTDILKPSVVKTVRGKDPAF